MRFRIQVRASLMPVICLILISLTGCGQSLDRMVEDCRADFPAYADAFSEVDQEWEDALNIASSTSRIALSGPVGQLQEIRRDASRLTPPACIADLHEDYIEGMDIVIGYFLDFMADVDADTDSDEITRALTQMAKLAVMLELYQEDPDALFEVLRNLAATATAEAAD